MTECAIIRKGDDIISRECVSNRLIISSEKIDEIISIPEGVTKIFCHHNNLTLLPPPPLTLRALYCGNNNLTELIIPEFCEVVNCVDNKIKSLDLRGVVKELYCQRNGLEEIKNSNSLSNLSSHNNNIEYIKITNQYDIVLDISNSSRPITIDIDGDDVSGDIYCDHTTVIKGNLSQITINIETA